MRYRQVLVIVLVIWGLAAHAADLDSTGVNFLRSLDPSLQGSNVAVIQAEAPVSSDLFEVNPTVVGQPFSHFTWLSSSGTATTFPNAVGGESFHANNVGDAFYGVTAGVAPGVAHVDNYEASFFYDMRVVTGTAIAGPIANQSFLFNGPSTPADITYDHYAARFATLFVNGAGNGGLLTNAPATSYNGITVGAYGGSSAVGPTPDGRSKPDITAPASLTSFSTPVVSGAAAVLLQAALRNDAGPGTASRAGDLRTLKALLLNGAQKPDDWTHVAPAPLDARYGAGVVNLWNSYRQLRGGRQIFQTNSTGSASTGTHPAATLTNSLPTRHGWDQNTIANSVSQLSVNHYLFDLRNASNRTFTLTATLVWLRQTNNVSINNLDLFLYNATSDTLAGASQSSVDNVEHLFLTNLPPARYDLQVLKNGSISSRITQSETYALAFEFGPPEDSRFTNTAFFAGQLQTKVFGDPNQNYGIYETSDFSQWTLVTTNRTSPDGIFSFTDPINSSNRFYRVKLAP